MSSYRDAKSSCEIAVFVATYQTDLRKLINTLRFIVRQKGVESQIVISDDGPGESCFEVVIQFFESVGYSNYELCFSKANEGTVINFRKGADLVKSLLVKPISPGNTFCDESTLARYAAVMSDHASFCFGRAMLHQGNGELEVFDLKRPIMLELFKTASGVIDTRLAKRSMLRYYNRLCGANIACRTVNSIRCLDLLSGKANYYEDHSARILLACDSQGSYIDDWVLWYKLAGEGCSKYSYTEPRTHDNRKGCSRCDSPRVLFQRPGLSCLHKRLVKNEESVPINRYAAQSSRQSRNHRLQAEAAFGAQSLQGGGL